MGSGTGVALAALLAASTGWSQTGQNAANGTQQTASQTQINMVPAKADLQKGLNAKKLKPGDTVTAKLTDTVNLSGQQSLQRNTVLVGHVDAVDASEHHSDSKVTVTFNQARLKDGTVMPVKVTVMQLTGPPVAASGMGSPGGPVTAPASAPGAGVGNGAGGPRMADTTRAKEDENSEPTGPSGAAPGGVTGQNGVPGVMVQSDIHDSASATFMSKGRNVNVPSGTEMQLAIAYVPPGVDAH